MAKDPIKPAPPPDDGMPGSSRHIVLEADWHSHLAGKVLIADIDLIAALDRDGAQYRAATPTEISIAGL